MNQDLEHLKLLSVFHYIVAVLFGLFACLPLIHFFMGLAMLFGWGEMGSNQAGWVGGLVAGIATVFILSGWALAICLGLAGKRLAERTHYNYCFVMACIACVFAPFGTILGVFTLLVLLRPSVKSLFGIPMVPMPVPPQPGVAVP